MILFLARTEFIKMQNARVKCPSEPTNWVLTLYFYLLCALSKCVLMAMITAR